MMMTKTPVYFFFLCLWLLPLGMQAQEVSLKMPLSYWATLTPTLGAEVKVGRQWTVDVLGAYRPWKRKSNKELRLWMVQPEGRYWFCEAFEGHFVGLHLHGTQYYGTYRHRIYDGYGAGGGISYGYHWILSPRWNLEAEIGGGYAYLWYKRMPNYTCKKCIRNGHHHYVGPTKVALSVCYVF